MSSPISITPKFVQQVQFLPSNKDLYSCLLVNKHWATCAVPILWEAPFRINNGHILSYKMIQTYLAFIPDSTFRKLGYNRRIGLSNNRPLFFNYPSFLKEFSFDQFLNSAIANNCCKDIIIELFKILVMNDVKLCRIDIYNHNCFNHYSENLNKIGYLLSMPMQKAQLFNAIAKDCHNIKILKISIYDKNEGIALEGLIRSQRNLKKFTLINSNIFASFPIQALVNQKHSLDSLALEDMHDNRDFLSKKFFNYTICQLNSSAINALAQCTKISKIKFKHCEGINSSVFLPLAIAFPNLTSLEYTYAQPLLDYYLDSLCTSCNTLKRIVFDWHLEAHLDITQLVEIISQQRNKST
ncbi:6243_t:CDS:2 [Dentiscutata heterogama]|uniref:6243_t:CDS:1 n=1 Tax=Dentiscutata heterogama TaxID=1316150 RepID=A0ACA9KCK0_9GLOM|nr:6243_t:CDS:2 [Dentiscutata heterogama]